MNAAVHDSVLTSVDDHIVATLAYYDIFNYPLKAEEVHRFLGTDTADLFGVKTSLADLCKQKRVFALDDFFSLRNDITLAQRRKKGNAAADGLLSLAHRRGRLIGRFPFVRGVLASGSLSKGFMDENSDLDFFVITAPGRLWIARMLLVVFKRLFLSNSHKYFCVNYFVDTNHLAIEEKNLFTATELATVIPLHGAEYYDQLMCANPWLNKFFPNYKQRPVIGVEVAGKSTLQFVLEKTINLLGAHFINDYFQGLTQKRWNKLYRHAYSEKDFEIAFKSKRYASKNHPRHYQKKVEELYRFKAEQFQVSLTAQWEHE